jgi:hypothetical protein
MLNGVTKAERIKRTTDGILNQVDDFRFIITEHLQGKSETEMAQLYELREDSDAEHTGMAAQKMGNANHGSHPCRHHKRRQP